MSTNLAAAAPLRRPREEPIRHLEIAPSRAQRRARPKVLYAVVLVAGVGAILLAQLLMSIALAGGAFQLTSLQGAQTKYSRQQQALTEHLNVLQSTQNLTAKAEQLGMVASGNPVYLNAKTGAVTGSASAAGGSLIGSTGNLVGNALLTGLAQADAAKQAALAAEQAAAAAAAPTPTGESDPTDADAATTGTDAPAATTGTTAGAPAPTAGTDSVPSNPGTLPSPVTH